MYKVQPVSELVKNWERSCYHATDNKLQIQRIETRRRRGRDNPLLGLLGSVRRPLFKILVSRWAVDDLELLIQRN